MRDVLVTFVAAGAMGFLFYKLKVPGGMLIGAICGTLLLAVTLRCASMPYAAKFMAQITAGAFIGCSVDKEELALLKGSYKVVLVVLGAFLLLNLALGMLLSLLFPFDRLTALLCTVPGGVSDVSLIASDMGADVTAVVVLQFVRLSMGLALFPAWIAHLARRRGEAQDEAEHAHLSTHKAAVSPWWAVVLTLVAAAASGYLGYRLRIPAGPLIFSIVASLAIKLRVFPVALPRPIKRGAQVFSGAYLGCSIPYEALAQLYTLLPPALVIVAAYMLNALVVGRFLTKKFRLPFKEAMLMMTPAGASDMALISADIGVQSSALIVVQIMRLLVTTTIFPQICLFLSGLFAS